MMVSTIRITSLVDPLPVIPGDSPEVMPTASAQSTETGASTRITRLP